MKSILTCLYFLKVGNVIQQLRSAVQECAAKFPLPVGNINAERPPATERFALSAGPTNPNDQIKVIVTLCGDSIAQVTNFNSFFKYNLKLDINLTIEAY